MKKMNGLNLSTDNAFKINQLIIDKIKDLKDANLDCSNSSAYFEQVKDRFYIFPDGLKFFLSTEWYHRYFRSDTVEILLTWDELKPYLKKKE
jgi:hypothetical protein